MEGGGVYPEAPPCFNDCLHISHLLKHDMAPASFASFGANWADARPDMSGASTRLVELLRDISVPVSSVRTSVFTSTSLPGKWPSSPNCRVLLMPSSPQKRRCSLPDSKFDSSPQERCPPESQSCSSPVKKQSKWTPNENSLIIELCGSGMKWEDISKRLRGRSAISFRLHYQNYLERRSEWDEEEKNKLARLYERSVSPSPLPLNSLPPKPFAAA